MALFRNHHFTSSQRYYNVSAFFSITFYQKQSKTIIISEIFQLFVTFAHPFRKQQKMHKRSNTLLVYTSL